MPAFRDRATGSVHLSPGAHDIRAIPGLEDVSEEDLDRIYLPSIEDGFVVPESGEFLTRREAAERYGADESRSLERLGVEIE